MAATNQRRGHAERTREKIKTGVLIDRLMKHAQGEIEMSQTQISAAKILLDRVMPTLKQAEIKTRVKGKVTVRVIPHAEPVREEE